MVQRVFSAKAELVLRIRLGYFLFVGEFIVILLSDSRVEGLIPTRNLGVPTCMYQSLQPIELHF